MQAAHQRLAAGLLSAIQHLRSRGQGQLQEIALGVGVEVPKRGLGSQPVERLRPKIVSGISGHHAAAVLREVGLQSAVGARVSEVKSADSDASRVGQALPVSARVQQQRREQAAQIQQLGDALHRFQSIRKALLHGDQQALGQCVLLHGDRL